MSQQTLSFLARYEVAPEALWAVVVDHEGMGDWLDANISVIAGPGDGGVGTVRRIKSGPLTIDEEVTVCDPPRRMVYRIVRGLPLLRYHQGEVRVSPWGDSGSELSWSITVSSAVPFFTEALGAVLRRSLNHGLDQLGQRLAR